MIASMKFLQAPATQLSMLMTLNSTTLWGSSPRSLPFHPIMHMKPASGYVSDTYASQVVLNSYYGVPLNSLDDLSWINASGPCREPTLFFSSLDLRAAHENGFSDAVLDDAVWRFQPGMKSIQPAISRADVLAPNGVRADPSGKYLYVTDVALSSLVGAGGNSSGSVAVFRFEVDEECRVGNKVLFALPRTGIADGIQIDNFGRVWTAEGEGVVVRDSTGRELGVFNAEVLVDEASCPIGMFSLAGDKLVVMGGDMVQVISLGQNVSTPAGTVV